MRLPQLTFGKILAGTAVVLAATTGTAVAHGMINSGDIVNNSIRSVDIKNGEVKSADIRNDGVRSLDVLDETLTAADLGPDSVRSSELGTITQRSATSGNIAAGSNGSVTANCLAGEQLISGGNDGFFDVFVVASRQNGNGWAVFAHNDSAGNRTITAHAYCLAP